MVQVHFQADMDAVLIVRANNREILRQNFDRGGLFRRRSAEGYDFTKTLEVSAGTSEILIHVTPRKRKAEIRRFDLLGSGSHRLEIYLSGSGQLTARLL
jgi:predicted nucleotidyltransferase